MRLQRGGASTGLLPQQRSIRLYASIARTIDALRSDLALVARRISDWPFALLMVEGNDAAPARTTAHELLASLTELGDAWALALDEDEAVILEVNDELGGAEFVLTALGDQLALVVQSVVPAP